MCVKKILNNHWISGVPILKGLIRLLKRLKFCLVNTETTVKIIWSSVQFIHVYFKRKLQSYQGTEGQGNQIFRGTILHLLLVIIFIIDLYFQLQELKDGGIDLVCLGVNKTSGKQVIIGDGVAANFFEGRPQILSDLVVSFALGKILQI